MARFEVHVNGTCRAPLALFHIAMFALGGVPVAWATAAPQAGPPRDGAPQPPSLARLSGRVVAADTGRPLAGAIVHIVSLTPPANPVEQEGQWVATDADGRWQLSDVAAGRYRVAISKGGYLRIQYGQQRPFEPGRTIDVKAGAAVANLDVTLPRGGAITGRVVDAYGDPVTGGWVSAFRYRYVDGRRQLTPLAEGWIERFTTGGLTDDLGQYRLFALPPGEYYVGAGFGAAGQSAERTGFPLSFHPGSATAADAQRVRVRIGQETQNVNMTLSTARYATVSGTVLSSTGAPVPASVALRGDDPVTATDRSTVTPRDGTFTLRDIAPGTYRLVAHHGGGGAQEFAFTPLAIAGEDVSGLTLVTLPGATATGRVVFDGGERPPARLWIRAFAAVRDASAFEGSSAGVQEDLTFELRGLIGRRVLRPTDLPDGWFLESVTRDGADITDSGHDFKPGEAISGIAIHLTQRATTLSGTVMDDRNRPLADYTIVAFATDASKWGASSRFVRSVRPDHDGSFSIRGLPPNDYLVIALEYVEPGQDGDPEQLERWRPLATSIALREGEATAVRLRLVR